MTGTTPQDGRHGRPEKPPTLLPAGRSDPIDEDDAAPVPGGPVIMDPKVLRTLRNLAANDNPSNSGPIRAWGLMMALVLAGAIAGYFLVR